MESEAAAGEGSLVVFRRYPNRRLYDTRASTYVGLEAVAAVVRGGATVRVEESRTGADITREVLLQALALQGEREGGSVLSPRVLHGLLRADAMPDASGAARAIVWTLEVILRAFAPRAANRAPPTVVAATAATERASEPTLEDRVAALEAAVKTLRGREPETTR